MAYDSLKVNTDRLRSDTSEMRSCLESAKSLTDDMFSDVENLETMWRGTASTAFKEQFSEGYESIKEYFSSVDKFINKLDEDSTAYENCERAVSDMVSSISV